MNTLEALAKCEDGGRKVTEMEETTLTTAAADRLPRARCRTQPMYG